MCVCVCIRIFFEYFIFGTRLRGRWKGWNSRNGNIAFSTLAWDKVRKSVEGAVRGKSVEGRDAIVDALREREREGDTRTMAGFLWRSVALQCPLEGATRG